MKFVDHLTRREYIRLIGLGLVSTQIPFIAYGNTNHSDNDYFRELYYKTISEISNLIFSKQITSLFLTKMMLERIEKCDKDLNSYVTLMSEQAIEVAIEMDKELLKGNYRGPLHGIPIGIKDLLFTKGARTMAGTKVFSDFIPDYNATVVEKLENAGAVILGKLTLCEGAQAPYHPDLKIPVNPWDASKWSGVSSSGSGVATAAGLCFGSIGTDTGGSIRYPSAVNGCVGLKPTYGRVSRYGVFALAESMDHVGPMTRSVEDAVIMYEAIAGFDPYDSTSLTVPVTSIRNELNANIKGLRIGFDRHYSTDNVDVEIVDALEQVLLKLEQLGAIIVDITMPDVGDPGYMWYILGTVEAALAHGETFPSRSEEYGIGFREDLEFGHNVSGVEYAKVTKMRSEFSEKLHQMLDNIDCMVCPSMSNPARNKSENPYNMSGEEWKRLNRKDVFSKPFNFSGVPTLSVPCGFSKDGIPLSVQFVGSKLDEAIICKAGYAYEQSTNWHTKHPRI